MLSPKRNNHSWGIVPIRQLSTVTCHLYWFYTYGGYAISVSSLLLTNGGQVVCVYVFGLLFFCIETEDRICGYEEGLIFAFMSPPCPIIYARKIKYMGHCMCKRQMSDLLEFLYSFFEL